MPGSTTPIDPDWLRTTYLAGAAQTALAAHLGVDRRTVRRHLDLHGIPRRPSPRRNQPDPRLADHEWLRRRYETERASTSTIAAETSTSVSTVHKYLRLHGIPRRPKGRSAHAALADPDWLRHQVLDLGRTPAAIADDLGVAFQTVYRHLRRHGVTRRPPLP